jgi:hypothetical protein
MYSTKLQNEIEKATQKKPVKPTAIVAPTSGMIYWAPIGVEHESESRLNIRHYKETNNPEFGEVSRVQPLQGEARWMAQIEGGAANDLASRSFTIEELRRSVHDFYFDIKKAIREELFPEYAKSDISTDRDKLIADYKKLWLFWEENPKLVRKPSWDIRKEILMHHFGGPVTPLGYVSDDGISFT